jgi:hypothetical protein
VPLPLSLGGDDTQDFPSQEHSPSDVDNKFSDYKRSGKDDFDITEADIQELRTSKYSSAHRKESLELLGASPSFVGVRANILPLISD